MQTLEIVPKSDPGTVYVSSSIYTAAQTRANGDVEIVANLLRGEQSLLLVIPKSKRAALAQFLIDAK